MTKTNINRVISVLMVACMTLSLVMVSVPVSAASGGTIIPLTDFESADKYLQIFKVPEVPNGINHGFGAGAGIYHFDKEDKALTLDYATESDGANYAICGSRYRFAMRIDSADIISENQSYMVVTYRTNATKKATMKFDDYSGTSVVLENDVTVSKGQWVSTKPVDITGKLFTRMRNPSSHNAITVNITDPSGTYFQLKEVAFFSSAKEANDYI